MIEELIQHNSYRPSGDPWLGRLPSAWQQMRLWTMSRPRVERNPGGLSLLSVFLGRGVIPYGEGSGQVHAPSLDLSNYQVVRSGDLVLNNQQAWRGSVGVSRHLGIISPAYIILELDRKLDATYANYLFRCPRMVDQFVAASKGVGDIQRQVFWPFLRRAIVPVPSIEEQHAIVRFLDHANRRIDRFIRAKRKLIALLNEQKQAIVHRTIASGLDRSLPTNESGVSWLGAVPAHWDVLPLRRFAAVASGNFIDPATVVRKQNTTHTIPVIGSNGPIGYSRRANSLKTTVVIGRVGSCGAVNLVQGPAWITDNALRVTELSGIEPRYLCEVLRAMNLGRLSTGSAQPLISGGTVKAQRAPRPPYEEQKAIVQELDRLLHPIENAITLAEREIALIREYRTRLTADVVTGQLDVRAAAASLPALDPDEPAAADPTDLDLDDDPAEGEDSTDLEGAPA
jgi:type I restriction enzyme S subunit